VLLIVAACGGGEPHFGAVTRDGVAAFEQVCRGWGAIVTDDGQSPDGRASACGRGGRRLRLHYDVRDRRLRLFAAEGASASELDRLSARLLAPVFNDDEAGVYRAERALVDTGAVPPGTPDGRWQDHPSGYWIEHPGQGWTELYWASGPLVMIGERSAAGHRGLQIKQEIAP
jgi:hypothetical protein